MHIMLLLQNGLQKCLDSLHNTLSQDSQLPIKVFKIPVYHFVSEVSWPNVDYSCNSFGGYFWLYLGSQFPEWMRYCCQTNYAISVALYKKSEKKTYKEMSQEQAELSTDLYIHKLLL